MTNAACFKLVVVRFLVFAPTLGMIHCQSALAQSDLFEKAPVEYYDTKVDDAVTRLLSRLESGKTRLEFKDRNGYLESLLKELNISEKSQTLVFSKTSLQTPKISPSTPRAIYFNDEVYVAWCKNGEFIEIAANDASQGPTFYTLDQVERRRIVFDRDTGQCMNCHAAGRTQDVPGYMTRSVYTTPTGLPNFGKGTFDTTVESPLKERWGGWYVTGDHGDMRHMGNSVFPRRYRGFDFEQGANHESIDDIVPTKSYLTPHSDIVALMVLDHQTQMTNALTYANYETRMALHQSYEMNKILERDPEYLSDSSKRRIKKAAERVVDHLLFCDEVELTDKIKGNSGYREYFEKQGPYTKDLKSLRQFDLEKRLFKYQCSYMIYSPSFDKLPGEVRSQVVDRLKKIFSGEDQSKKYNHLSKADRRSISKILAATKPDFASPSSVSHLPTQLVTATPAVSK